MSAPGTPVGRAAAAIANARGGRRGVPPIVNILDVLPQKLRDEVTDDAGAALAEVGFHELLAAARRGHWVADGPGCKPGCPLCAAISKAEGR